MSNMYGFENLCSSEDISHHGTLGMKWGVRKYQNKNGSLTPEGIQRYKKMRKNIKTQTKRVRALEENLRNKADIAAPAQEKVKRSQSEYEETLKRNSKKKLFESRVHKEQRLEEIRRSEYALNKAKEDADRSKQVYKKASYIYEGEMKELVKMVNQAIKEYGDKNVNDIKFKEVDIGFTPVETSSGTKDYSAFKTKIIKNYGFDPFGLKVADISSTVIEMEKKYDKEGNSQ